jgi:hypothetical protein
MNNKKIAMCPLFDDLPCPQGADAAEQCQIRFENDYDPVRDFKDSLFMECAILRARESDNEVKKKNQIKG